MGLETGIGGGVDAMTGGIGPTTEGLGASFGTGSTLGGPPSPKYDSRPELGAFLTGELFGLYLSETTND